MTASEIGRRSGPWFAARAAIVRLALPLLLACGCNWYSPARAHETLQNIHDLMAHQRYDQALAVLRASKSRRPPQGQPRLAIWKPWDRIVYWMEEGMLAFLAGRYDQSIAALQRAEARIEESYTRSIRRTHAAVSGGAYEDDYRPPGYERLALHNLLVLAFMAKADLAGAIVAARKAREVARYLAGRDGTRRLDSATNATYLKWVASKTSPIALRVAQERAQQLWQNNGWSALLVQPDALGPWLDGLVHGVAGDASAEVAFRRALAAAEALPLAADALAWLREDVRASAGPSQRPRRGQLVVVHLRGRGPRLEARRGYCVEEPRPSGDDRHPAAAAHRHAPIAAEEILVRGIDHAWRCAHQPPRAATQQWAPGGSAYRRPSVAALDPGKPGLAITVRVGTLRVRPQTLVDVSALARNRFAARQSMTYWRALMRQELGPGSVGQETRSWRTLPAQIDVGHAWLPEGTARLEIRTSSGRRVTARAIEIRRDLPAVVVVQSF